MTESWTGSDEDEREDGPPPAIPGVELAPGYAVVAHLRRGEDLDVYDVWSDERNCRCVAKTIRPDRIDRESANRRLIHEGELLLGLTHPHIVRAYDLVRGDTPVLVLETLPGETLSHLIDRGAPRLAAAEVAHLGRHLCSAVGYLHRHGILHLDLKPSNIIATGGLARVLDLSLAQPPGPIKPGVGTLGYMAPEQARGGEIGPAADVWGIGAVLYEVATGEPAWETDEIDDGTDASPRTEELEIPAPAPIRRHRRLPASLAEAIDATLTLDAAARPTVRELDDALGKVV
ncbi:MAG: serine/threonine protein kinase [Chloroflexia bacterium]|nr:serine/threonine protein kinase [Chloroflexia bacterium]